MMIRTSAIMYLNCRHPQRCSPPPPPVAVNQSSIPATMHSFTAVCTTARRPRYPQRPPEYGGIRTRPLVTVRRRHQRRRARRHHPGRPCWRINWRLTPLLYQSKLQLSCNNFACELLPKWSIHIFVQNITLLQKQSGWCFKIFVSCQQKIIQASMHIAYPFSLRACRSGALLWYDL